MKRNCKGCGITMTNSDMGNGFCTIGCMKDKAKEYKRKYWELISDIRSFEKGR